MFSMKRDIWGVYLGIPDFHSLPGLVLNILKAGTSIQWFYHHPIEFRIYILDMPHFQTHTNFTIWSTDEALSPYQSPM